MSVARILAAKGRDVVTTDPKQSLATAAGVLAAKGIGALIVTNDSREVVGILSERDVVRAVAHGGTQVLAEPVSAHMTTKVMSAAPDMSIIALMEMMTKGRFRHIPILDQGRLDGLVSIGDVVKHRLAEIEGESQALRDYIATA